MLSFFNPKWPLKAPTIIVFSKSVPLYQILMHSVYFELKIGMKLVPEWLQYLAPKWTPNSPKGWLTKAPESCSEPEYPPKLTPMAPAVYVVIQVLLKIYWAELTIYYNSGKLKTERADNFFSLISDNIEYSLQGFVDFDQLYLEWWRY